MATGMAMLFEDEVISENEDASATRQNETIFCSICSTVLSRGTNCQECLELYNVEETSTINTVAATANTPAARQSLAYVSMFAEELELQSKLRKQRLLHKLREENLKHLLELKEISQRLTTPYKKPEELNSAIHMPCMSTPSDGLELGMPVASSCPVELVTSSYPDEQVQELTKKLHFQRLKHQIETEEALHKLKMKQLESET